jgi:hypothetical protein
VERASSARLVFRGGKLWSVSIDPPARLQESIEVLAVNTAFSVGVESKEVALVEGNTRCLGTKHARRLDGQVSSSTLRSRGGTGKDEGS